jgi:Rod binding domain-containing protein
MKIQAPNTPLGASSFQGPELGKTAEEFEALLLRNVVESMQKTAKLDGESSGNQLTDHLIEDALANHLAKSGGIGLARYLQGEMDQPATVPRSDMHLTLEKWVRYKNADGSEPNPDGAMASELPRLLPTRAELTPTLTPPSTDAAIDPLDSLAPLGTQR